LIKILKIVLVVKLIRLKKDKEKMKTIDDIKKLEEILTQDLWISLNKAIKKYFTSNQRLHLLIDTGKVEGYRLKNGWIRLNKNSLEKYLTSNEVVSYRRKA